MEPCNKMFEKLNLLVTFVPDIASQDEVKYKSTFVRKYLPTCLLT